MLHKMIEEGGVPFLYREMRACEAELGEQQRIYRALRRLGQGMERATSNVESDGSDLLEGLLCRAEELAGECRRALWESERLLSRLDEEHQELLALLGRAR